MYMYLQSVDRYYTQNVLRWGVAEEDVDKRDDLQGFPQAHGVGQDAAEPRAGMEPRQTLNEVVVEKPHPSDLHVHSVQVSGVIIDVYIHVV